MEIILITTAFLAGFIALKCNLPPLVGFLLAGFGLHAFGYQSNDVIVTLADLGVTLLLFTIGLKLDVKTLLSKEIWGGATAHNILSTLFFRAGSRWSKTARVVITLHDGSQPDSASRLRPLLLQYGICG